MRLRSMHNERGQFIPISLMVMFTIVVMMVAVVNVYRVSREKLKVQNLADAVALNVASQMAQAINTTADRNEWLNHIYDKAPDGSPWPPRVGGNPNDTSKPIDCARVRAWGPNQVLPPLACLPGWTFKDRGQAQTYARLINKVNEAQKIFGNTYNVFLNAQGGAGGGFGFGVGRRGLEASIKADIPDLNGARYKFDVREYSPQSPNPNQPFVGPQNPQAQFAARQSQAVTRKIILKPASITVRWNGSVLGGGGSGTLESLAGVSPGQGVGWMSLDQQSVGPSGKMGATVTVSTLVSTVAGSHLVEATSSAYVVPGSGQIGPISATGGSNSIQFRPTFYAKLVQ